MAAVLSCGAGESSRVRGRIEGAAGSVMRGCPFGSADWVEATAKRLHLGQTLRPQCRPVKPREEPEESVVERSVFD